MMYKLKPMGVQVNLTPAILIDQGKTQRRIKSALTRAGVDWVSVVSHGLLCAWCSKPNSTVVLGLRFDGLKIELSNAGYVKPLRCCFTKGCEYKKLNPNSVEFIARSRGISNLEARSFLHKRNKTPFYKENHKTDESYRQYQGSRCFTGDETDRLIIAKQNYARSLQGYRDRFGGAGDELWSAVQARKGITIQNLTRKYGENAPARLSAWKNSVSCSLENFIRRHGEERGTALYKKTVSTHGYYSPITFTKEGSALRSNLERTFYDILISAGLIENKDFLIDGNYTESSQRYDFWFPALDLFIEIAGCNTKKYRDKMNQKREKYNAKIISPSKVSKTAMEIVVCLSQ